MHLRLGSPCARRPRRSPALARCAASCTDRVRAEGADAVIAYLSEDSDAEEVAGLVEEAGRRAVLVCGDLSWPQHCRDVIARTVAEFGQLDVPVSNAAYQMTHESLEDIPDEEWATRPAHAARVVDHRQFVGELRHAEDGGYISGARIPVTGGRPVL